MAMNDSDIDEKIRSLIEQKISLFKQYLSITKTMKEVLGQGEKIDPRGLLAMRRSCIFKIQKMDRALHRTINAGSTAIDRFPGILKGLFDGYTNIVRDLIEQIIPVDKDIIEVLNAEYRGIRAELLKINITRYAAKGYSCQGYFMPRYLDTKR